MRSKRVRLDSIIDTVQFIAKLEPIDSSIYLRSDSLCVNAKSLLGVLSLGLDSTYELEIGGEEADIEAVEDAICEYLTS